MADFTLQQSTPFEGCDLPISLGAARLETVSMGAITAVMPLNGQLLAVNKVIKSACTVELPAVGAMVQGKGRELVWFGPGQWFIIGDPMQNLDGLAAVTDQTDGWAVMLLSGEDAGAVMARLCPLDMDTTLVGQVARSEFAHVSAVIIPRKDGIQIMVPRSFARASYENTVTAMQSLAAQRLL